MLSSFCCTRAMKPALAVGDAIGFARDIEKRSIQAVVDCFFRFLLLHIGGICISKTSVSINLSPVPYTVHVMYEFTNGGFARRLENTELSSMKVNIDDCKAYCKLFHEGMGGL